MGLALRALGHEPAVTRTGLTSVKLVAMLIRLGATSSSAAVLTMGRPRLLPQSRQTHGPGPRWVRTASGTARPRLVRPVPSGIREPQVTRHPPSGPRPTSQPGAGVQVPSDTPPELQLLPSPNLLVLADPADRRVRVKPRTTAIPRVDAIRRHLGWLTRLAASRSPHLDACIMLGNKPWDTSAGVLVARKAGARVLDHDGTEHSQQSHSTNRSHTSAGNRSHGGSTRGVS
jgi:hypothetical protein